MRGNTFVQPGGAVGACPIHHNSRADRRFVSFRRTRSIWSCGARVRIQSGRDDIRNRNECALSTRRGKEGIPETSTCGDARRALSSSAPSQYARVNGTKRRRHWWRLSQDGPARSLDVCQRTLKCRADCIPSVRDASAKHQIDASRVNESVNHGEGFCSGGCT